MNFTEYTTKRKEAAKTSNVIKTGRIDSEMMHSVLSKIGRCVGGADGMALCGDDYFWLVVPVSKTDEILSMGFVYPNRTPITKPSVTSNDGKKVQFMIDRNSENLKVCHDILEAEEKAYQAKINNINAKKQTVAKASRELFNAEQERDAEVKTFTAAELKRYRQENE